MNSENDFLEKFKEGMSSMKVKRPFQIFFVTISLLMMVSQSLLAQEGAPAAPPAAEAGAGADANMLDDSLTDVYTVVGTTAAGAILGLSTLSFVEEPKAHVKNIVVGGAIGIIVGVGVVAWSQASRSRSLYESQMVQPEAYFKGEEDKKNFSTTERLQNFSRFLQQSNQERKSSWPHFSYSFTF